MKSPLEVARWLADRLDEDSLPYALGGALALAAWSGPRQILATHPVHEEMGQRRRAVEVDGELDRAVREYGRTLVALPEEAWGLVDVHPLEDGSGVALEVPMWTIEEGRSDLTLELSASERDASVAIEIDDLHVL